MRIAVVTETFYPFMGGSARRYHEVLKRLVDRGYEVDLYTVRLKEDWKVYEVIDGIHVYRTEHILKNYITKDGFRSIRDVFRYTLWVLRKLGDRKYDLIEANHCPIFPLISSQIKSRFYGVPLVGTFHEVWYHNWYWYVPHKIYAPIGILLEKFYVYLPDKIVAVSEMVRDRLINYLNVPSDKVVVIENGVDTNSFNVMDNGIYNHRGVIYIGRLNPHKKVDWLLKAIKLVRRAIPDIRLDIVGDGPYRKFYMRVAEELGLDGNVVFHGKVDDHDMVELLKTSRIYVLPSIREGQSITTLEAMAAGVPQIVIEIDGNGAVELVKSSGSGLVVKPSIRELATSIIRLINDDSLYKVLRSNGLEYVRRHTWDRVANMYHNLYMELISR
ncbi:MAG TPA: glycosyltransferase family 1 protein [Thermoprotei archaeon]|nr:glycosyltransferase family 1 protein [Thermoprotei archaeon]